MNTRRRGWSPRGPPEELTTPSSARRPRVSAIVKVTGIDHPVSPCCWLRSHALRRVQLDLGREGCPLHMPGHRWLLPASCLPRWADATEVVGAALLAKALGHGYRRIAVDLRRPASTVPGGCGGLGVGMWSGCAGAVSTGPTSRCGGAGSPRSAAHRPGRCPGRPRRRSRRVATTLRPTRPGVDTHRRVQRRPAARPYRAG